MLDEAGFPHSVTVAQVDAMMRHIYRDWDSSVFYGHISRFGLPKGKAFQDFSRGMKMKLSIAVALSHKARLLILDEATSGLDPIVRDEILDLFYEFTRDEEHAILISSHIVSDLEKLCDYIAFLHRGKLLLCEEQDRLLESYGLLTCSKADLAALSPAAVAGKRECEYGVEALIRRREAPRGLSLNRAGIEDVIVYLAKEARCE